MNTCWKRHKSGELVWESQRNPLVTDIRDWDFSVTAVDANAE